MFHLISSSIQSKFYITRLIEFSIFCFAVWRSKRVNHKKLNESMQKIEENEGGDQKELEIQSVANSNIHKIRDQFFS